MNISMFHQAQSRIDFATRVVKRNTLRDITKLALPSVLILDKNRACVLLNYDLDKGIAQVIIPGLSSGETEITVEKLESEYTGEVIIIKPEYNFNNRIEKEVKVENPKDWFWGTLKRNTGIYKQVIVVSLFINLFFFFILLFTM